MAVEIKYCGLTRAADAHAAAMCGARYVGVVFAAGPRAVDPSAAGSVLDGAGATVVRVGVFGAADAAEIARVTRLARLDVVQLHGDPSERDVRRVRERTGARVWAVLRFAGAPPADRVAVLDGEADALVYDALAPGKLGGTGTSFNWHTAAGGARPRRSRLVVAGGLTPENVSQAIAALSPDVVDVSSGVEERPGIKDHERMRLFAEAVIASRGHG